MCNWNNKNTGNKTYDDQKLEHRILFLFVHVPKISFMLSNNCWICRVISQLMALYPTKLSLKHVTGSIFNGDRRTYITSARFPGSPAKMFLTPWCGTFDVAVDKGYLKLNIGRA